MRDFDLEVRQPMELAYRAAEDVADDAREREVRRTRLLRAIKAPGGGGAAVAARPVTRGLRPWGGWLLAAGVACLAVLIGVNLGGTGEGVGSSAGATSSVDAASTVVADAVDAVRKHEPGDADVRSAHKAGSSASSFPGQRSAESENAAARPSSALTAEAATLAGAAAPVSEEGAPARAASMEERRSLTSELLAFAASGNSNRVVALLERGVPVDARFGGGNTALMTSLVNKRYETARVLVDRGASLDIRNQDGVSAREMLISSGDSELMKIGTTKPR